MLHVHFYDKFKQVISIHLDTCACNIIPVTIAKRFKRINILYFMCNITLYVVCVGTLIMTKNINYKLLC